MTLSMYCEASMQAVAFEMNATLQAGPSPPPYPSWAIYGQRAQAWLLELPVVDVLRHIPVR